MANEGKLILLVKYSRDGKKKKKCLKISFFRKELNYQIKYGGSFPEVGEKQKP